MMENNTSAHERVLGRILALSDGVFAIAITLMILNLFLPEGTSKADLADALLSQWQKYLEFLLSFFVIGVYWFNHVRQFRLIRMYSTGLIWLNLLFLLFIVIIPFTTSVLSKYQGQLSVVLYAANMVMEGLMAFLLWFYATHNRRLVDESLDEAIVRRGIILNLVPPAIFALSIGVAFINADAAQYLWVSIYVLYVLLSRLLKLPRADENT
jgi:uncharacterized membrane protein